MSLKLRTGGEKVSMPNATKHDSTPLLSSSEHTTATIGRVRLLS